MNLSIFLSETLAFVGGIAAIVVAVLVLAALVGP